MKRIMRRKGDNLVSLSKFFQNIKQIIILNYPKYEFNTIRVQDSYR